MNYLSFIYLLFDNEWKGLCYWYCKLLTSQNETIIPNLHLFPVKLISPKHHIMGYNGYLKQCGLRFMGN